MEQQRTKEWFEKRKGKVTGSNVGAILGCDPYRKPADVMRQMVREWHGAENEIKDNPAFAWGRNNEAVAIQQLEMLHLSAPVEETGFHVHPKYEWLGASPDGLIGNDGVAEIKCPYGLANKDTPIFKSLSEQPHYFAQTQIEMACTGRTWCMFYQWAPNGDLPFEQQFHQPWFDEALPKLEAFYNAFLVEREMTSAQRYLEPKHKEQDDTFITDLAEQYNVIVSQIKELEVEKKDLLASIVERCGERQSQIGNKKLTLVERKGNVNYKKVPELEGVDLELYRGKPSTYWSLK